MNRHPDLPWILPFAVFMLLLSVGPHLGLSQRAELAVRLIVPAAALVVFSRRILDFRCAAPWLSGLVGVGVFVIWVAPDVLFPGYRESVLFQNALTGQLKSTLPVEAREDALAIVMRVASSHQKSMPGSPKVTARE